MKKIKFCGINNLEFIEDLLKSSYLPDFLGFIFYDKSPRNIELNLAKEFQLRIPNKIKKIAVTVNNDLNTLENIIQNLKPDFLQLHGNETVEDVNKIKNEFGLKIIKAIAIANKEDLESAEKYQNIVDFLLFDTKTNLYGGSGKSFDWSILKPRKNKDYFLSGGLNISNLETAIKTTDANYFDISSGIELQKGVKDIKKAQEILEFFKNYNASK